MSPPIALNSNLPESVDPSFRRFARNVGAIIDQPLYRASVSFDAQGTVGPGIRRVSVQVRNRRGDPLSGRFIVHCWLAATADGGPQSAQSVTFRAGTILETVVGNGEWRVLTDEAGRIVMDTGVLGSATRYARSFVLSRIDAAPVRQVQPAILAYLYTQAIGVDYGDLPVIKGKAYDFIDTDVASEGAFDAAVAAKIPDPDADGDASLDCENVPVTLPTSAAGYADPAWIARRATARARLLRGKFLRPRVRWGVYQQPFYNVYDATGVGAPWDANRAAWLAAYTGASGLPPLLAASDASHPEIFPHNRTATEDEVDTFCRMNVDLCRQVNALVTPAAERLVIPFIYVTDPGDPYNGRAPANPPDFLPAAELARYFSGLKKAGADAIFMAGAHLTHTPAIWQDWADTILAEALDLAGYT